MKFFIRCAFIFSLSFHSLKVVAQQVRKPFYKSTAFKTLAAPTVLVTYGMWCKGENGKPSSVDVYNYRNENYPNFHTKADDYIVFVPAAAVYGLDLLKVKSAHDPLNQTLIFAKTTALTMATVYALKYASQETRPDGSNEYSFPSAHTALAFAYATVLHQEYKDKSVWIGVAGYATAAGVGALRILNNEHWFNDVLVGAGIGILSTKLVYLTHQNKYKWDWRKNNTFLPNIGNKNYGLAWQHTF